MTVETAEKTVTMDSPEDIALADRMNEGRRKIEAELAKLIVGQQDVVNQVLLTLFVGGNSLIVGVPGLAKTLLIRTLAQVLELKFNRIQFTPDLMPSDITGTDIIQEDAATGRRQMIFAPGPIFANIVLADEINRTPPKTQAALLEAMQERSVTLDGATHQLGDAFLVIATQNPIEQEGTYPLPEAQLDRFLLKLRIGYPGRDEERQMAVVHGSTAPDLDAFALQPVAGREFLAEARAAVRANRLEDPVRVEVLRQRQLHEDAVHRRIRVQPGNVAEQFGFGRFGRQACEKGADADLLARLDLVAHVHGRGRVVAHEDHREAGRVAGGGQRLDAGNEAAAGGRGKRLAVDDACRHVGLLLLDSRAF